MKLWSLIIGIGFVSMGLSYTCDRTPKNTFKTKLSNDKYFIEISGNPKGYTPKENYTISLKAELPSVSYFQEFFIIAEPLDGGYHPANSLGKFIPLDEMLATYTHKCPNAMVQTTLLPKTSVDVLWRAPTSNSGCIALKATVIESSDSWFSDDNGLTKILCMEDERNEDRQPPFFPFCAVCNEAKYEIAFEGMWSRNTHPKEYPSDMWSTKLGDIVGASHKYGKSFWNYGAVASAGLKSLAEKGDTKELETELIEMLKDDDIRTIVKARELSYPNTTSTSYTVFRVDKENHLLSLVSKITPSPDWIVGVANLELCSNGTWVQAVTLNLYPWDIGTDDGLKYDAADVPTYPRQTIRRIKSNSPNHPDSPFYREDGAPIKPIAKLHVTRQKIYEKFCEDSTPETLQKQEQETCALSEWGSWSSCTASCGVRARDRKFLNKNYQSVCGQDATLALQETEICEDDCEGDEYECKGVEWGPWSECSTTCGTGSKERTRTDGDDDACVKETVECYNPPCEDEANTSQGEFVGPVAPESQTNVLSQSAIGEVINCKVSDWSNWGACSATAPCSRGYQYKERHIIRHPQNGGHPCPSKLRKKKRCKIPCSSRGASATVENANKIDCLMGPWSSWSPCSSICGSAVQQRTREILREPKNGGLPCSPRIQERKCPLPLACNNRQTFPFYR